MFRQPGSSCPLFAVTVMTPQAALSEHSLKRFLHEHIRRYVFTARQTLDLLPQGSGYVDAKPHVGSVAISLFLIVARQP